MGAFILQDLYGISRHCIVSDKQSKNVYFTFIQLEYISCVYTGGTEITESVSEMQIESSSSKPELINHTSPVADRRVRISMQSPLKIK